MRKLLRAALRAVSILVFFNAHSGDGQTGTISTTLQNPIIAQVNGVDINGNLIPLAGISVAFSVTSPLNATGAVLSNATAITGADGIASTQLTLGNLPGQYQVTADCEFMGGCHGGIPSVTFNETAVTPVAPTGIIRLCADAFCQTASATNEVSILPSRDVEPPPPTLSCKPVSQSQTVGFRVGCFDSQTGQSIADCKAGLSLTTVSFSGGHDHDAPPIRPAGSLDISSGATGSSGFPVTYTAPEVSGQVTLSFNGTQSNGTPLQSSRATIDIRVGGLTAMPELSPYYSLVGSTPTHLDNHFASPHMNAALAAIAADFAGAFPGSVLLYNDVSLVEGGVFDLNQNWTPPHCGHLSLGGGTNNADISISGFLMQNVAQDVQDMLEDIVTAHNGNVCVKHNNHWHLCF